MSIAVAIALLSAVGTLYAAYSFSQFPDAVEEFGHDDSMFRQVLAGRYVFMAAMLVGSAFLAQAGAIGFVLISLACVGLWDWFIYSNAGFEATSHMLVAVLALILGVLVLLIS